MTLNFRTIWLLLANHLLSWMFVFILIVGFDLDLVPSYFYMGWSFSGGELPSLVWLFSWAMFIIVMLLYFVLQRVVSGLTLRSRGTPQKRGAP
jgi:hypothetical protein